jgi:hypothetical protein
MERTNERKFTFEGEVGGTTFKQTITVPQHDDTGGGHVGGGDGAVKYFVFFGPVIVVEDSRVSPKA